MSEIPVAGVEARLDRAARLLEEAEARGAVKRWQRKKLRLALRFAGAVTQQDLSEDARRIPPVVIHTLGAETAMVALSEWLAELDAPGRVAVKHDAHLKRLSRQVGRGGSVSQDDVARVEARLAELHRAQERNGRVVAAIEMAEVDLPAWLARPDDVVAAVIRTKNRAEIWLARAREATEPDDPRDRARRRASALTDAMIEGVESQIERAYYLGVGKR